MVLGGDRLRQYLKSKDVRARDIPKVLIAFKACYFATWFGCIPICARFRPLSRFFQLSYPRMLKQRLISRFPKQYASWEKHTYKTSEWFGGLRVIRWIPESFGQTRKDFGIATAESYILIHLLYPFWGSAAFLMIVRHFQRRRSAQTDIPSMHEITDSIEQSYHLSAMEWIQEHVPWHRLDLKSNDDDDDPETD